eukprot:4539343-Pleurochrysis_carterae.AAC.7
MGTEVVGSGVGAIDGVHDATWRVGTDRAAHAAAAVRVEELDAVVLGKGAAVAGRVVLQLAQESQRVVLDLGPGVAVPTLVALRAETACTAQQ